jgi:hypothetical protein
MLGDPIKTMASSQGAINIEMNYPVDNSPESDMLRSAFYNTWTNAPASTMTARPTASSPMRHDQHRMSSSSGGASSPAGISVRRDRHQRRTTRCTTGSATAATIVGSGSR